MIWHTFPGSDLCCAGLVQPLTTAGEELDDLDHDLSDLCDICPSWERAARHGRSRALAPMTILS